jgi:hypothetical protein
MNLQKNQENTKEHNSKFQKLKFVVTSVSSCQYKFSNIAKYYSGHGILATNDI